MDIKLYPPPSLEDQYKPSVLEFGKDVSPKRWIGNMCVVWTHTHRLVGFTHDHTTDALRKQKPFFIHHVGTWISQVGFVKNVQTGQVQVQSAQTITLYDNMAALDGLLITQPSAFSLAPDLGQKMSDWLISAYLSCFDPSNLQIVPGLPRSPNH